MMKKSWERPGRFVMGIGGLLWAVAVLSQCGGDTSAGFSASVFLVGIGLLLVGGWMARPSRRSVMADRAVTASPMTAIWMEESAAVTVHQSEYDIRMFEVSIGAASVLLGGKRVRLGGDQEWTLRVSRHRASIGSGRVALATARRVAARSSQWVVNDGTRDYWLERSEDRSVEKVRSSKNLWGKDTHVVTRRRGLVSLSDSGAPVAVVDLEYTVDSQMTKKIDGHRDVKGDFSGEIDIRSPVPVPVAVLCLRLTLSRWAKQPPQTGEWVFTPPAGG